MRSMLKISFIFLTAVLTLILSESPSNAKDWHEEFKYICSKVEMGDSLSLEELQSLIERSEALLKSLETVNEPSKKVYIFRLKKCKAFFEYLIELKKSSDVDKPAP